MVSFPLHPRGITDIEESTTCPRTLIQYYHSSDLNSRPGLASHFDSEGAKAGITPSTTPAIMDPMSRCSVFVVKVQRFWRFASEQKLGIKLTGISIHH